MGCGQGETGGGLWKTSGDGAGDERGEIRYSEDRTPLQRT
jgi:hypothetical protein